MSLSSLWGDYHYQCGRAGYWNTSASQYCAQITDLTGQISEAQEQLALAQDAKAKIGDAKSQCETTKTELGNFGTSAGNAADSADALNAARNLTAAVESDISTADGLADALISKINDQITNLQAQKKTAEEGRDYSYGQASRWSARADRTMDAINNYSEDD